MSAYQLTPEFYVMPATTNNGKPVPSIDFQYAIRRDDGSLVFRAESLAFAQECLDNLRRELRLAEASA